MRHLHFPQNKGKQEQAVDQFGCPYAGFRLTCRLPHCRFDDDICTTAQAPLAAEG